MSQLAAAAAAAAGASDGGQQQGNGDDNGQQGQQQQGQQGQQGGASRDGQQQGQQGATQDGAAQLYRPQGLADHLVGKDDRETIDKLYRAYEPLRQKMAQFEPAKSAADLKFEPNEQLKPYFGKADDPALKIARDAWVKGGGTAQSFQPVIENLYGAMIEAKLLPPPFDPKAELAAFAKASNLADAAAVNAAVTDLTSFADTMAAQLKLPEAVKGELDMLTDSAAGLQLLSAIRTAFKEKGLEFGGGQTTVGGNWTREQLRQMQSDERLDPNSKKYDPALRAQVDEAYKRLGQKK